VTTRRQQAQAWRDACAQPREVRSMMAYLSARPFDTTEATAARLERRVAWVAAHVTNAISHFTPDAWLMLRRLNNAEAD
jgi:hypothetical protein